MEGFELSVCFFVEGEGWVGGGGGNEGSGSWD